jgi:AraC-like DNA-binding protein
MLPLRSIEGVLIAATSLGLDADRARAAASIDPRANPDALLSIDRVTAVWADLVAQRPSPELATELGFAAPIGCFGIVDYLAGSSSTLEGAMRALATHFSGIARDMRLTLRASATGHTLSAHAPDNPAREELTLAITVGRFRRLAAGPFALERLSLRQRFAGPTRHEVLYGCPVDVGAPESAMHVTRATSAMSLSTADPQLASALASAAAQLGFGGPETSEVEAAVRSRLRDLLAQGRGDAASVARTIGTSERTLHRRLAGAGLSYQSVLDAFRRRESERLLLAGAALPEIALALGYSDQSAWSRAFKRWAGVSPREWRGERAGA